MLRVSLVAPIPPPYGGIAHWAQLILGHATKGEEVQFSVVNTAPRWRSFHRTGVLLRAVGGGLQVLRDIFMLAQGLYKEKQDVIHLTTSGSLGVMRDLAVCCIAWVYRVPIVYHVHFGRIPDLIGADALEWRLLRKVMLCADAVILIDRASFGAVMHAEPDINARLVPNCIDIESLPSVTRGSGAEAKCALFLGWVLPSKGIDELVRAWGELAPVGWRLDIVGPCDPRYRDELLPLCSRLQIRFVGRMNHGDAMKMMASCDLFVLPSHTEGFPNVVLEAMALGKPIVATDVGALPEMLSEECGVVIESRSVEALGRGLDQLIENEELRSMLGRNAWEKARRQYALDTVFAAYVDIWGDLKGAANAVNNGRPRIG